MITIKVTTGIFIAITLLSQQTAATGDYDATAYVGENCTGEVVGSMDGSEGTQCVDTINASSLFIESLQASCVIQLCANTGCTGCFDTLQPISGTQCLTVDFSSMQAVC